jgi:hypothetical protein
VGQACEEFQGEKEMNCTNCGNVLRPGDQFCLKCGGPAPPSDVETSGQAAPASTPPPEDYKPPQQQPQSYPEQTAQTYPPQQPQASPPSDAQAQARTLLGLAMVFSLIGGIMLMVLEFGGWYNYNDYYHSREWGWVGPLENPLSFLPFLAVAGGLFYCSFIAYQQFSSKEGLKRSLVMRGFVISLIVFIIVIIGGATLIALTWENDSQWLSEGFYGGAIGSLLTFILFWLVLKNIPHTKVDKRARYGAQPYGAQPPYPQTQVPQGDGTQMIPGTEPSSQPESAQESQVTGTTEGEEEQTPQEEEPKPQEEPKQEPPHEVQPAQKQAQQPQSQQQQYQQPYYPQYQQQQPQQQTYPCRTCGRPLRYVPEYRRWYCDTCRQYV